MIAKPMDTHLPLSPRSSPWMHRLRQDFGLLDQLLNQYGSPVNIHHTGPFRNNYEEFKAVFEEFGLDHLVLFARKANKCQTFAEAACRLGFGVDTASYRELKQCLDLGCEAYKLVLTAAVKDTRTLRLAIEHEVLIILDNEDECTQVQSLASQLNKQAKVGLRVSGFHYQGEKLYSRFGFDIDNVEEFARMHLREKKDYPHLRYQGLHFHLNGYSPQQRGAALLACLQLADRLKLYQLTTQFIDMGGGILMNYLEDPQQWRDFEEAIQRAVRGERRPLTFQNDGLGYRMIDGQLRGQLNTYPYYNEKPRAVFLREVLNHTGQDGVSVGEGARLRQIQLRIEPGRSMLDQCGLTVARVAFRKQDAQGSWLVGLEMNMTQMYSSSADFLLDPWVVYRNPGSEAEGVGVYFTGAYCLERDVLLKRKIHLPRLPEIGDQVIFMNTAGYMMHFFESEAHLFELAENIFYRPTEEGPKMTDFFPDGSNKRSTLSF